MALTGGTLGKVTWVKDDYGVVVQNYRVGNFFTDEKLCSKRFLMYALLSPVFQTLMYSKINVAAQPNIGKEEIENLEFILPSLEEQSKVVDRLDNLTFKVKQIQSKLEEQLAYLKQLKSSILSKAFKGEL
jgi:type I restriction enzyme S subunit